MHLADIRTRLAGLEGRAYWRSLEELADTDDFKQYVRREFPDQASEFNDPAGRRTFLKLMGASLALAGVSACTRQPPEKLVPYVRQPEEIVPGRPLFFATAMPQGGVGMPLLAENHMGRPTKLEGNPEHPASLGATDLFSQAAVLTLYDPDRSRTVINRSEVKTWGAFTAALSSALGATRSNGGAGFRLLTEPVSSPSLLDQMDTLLAAYPQAKWHQWDAVYGARQGGAPSAHAIYKFDKADVVLSLDADFLGMGPGSVRYAKDFSSRRRIGTPGEHLNRLYVVEPVPTVTGSMADHRLALKARDVYAVAAGLASALGVAGAPAGAVPAEAAKFVSALAADLKANAGKSAVVAGDYQPAAVHALARAINDALGNSGATVVYTAPITGSPADGTASISELVADMKDGKVQTLLMIGGNPVFTAPADLDFKSALDKVTTRVHVGLHYDETAELCHWHANESHFLEAWGDVRAFDGTVSLIQPLIAPIYDGHSALEVVAALNGVAAAPIDLVKGYWTRAFAGQTKTVWTVRDREGKAFATADGFWRHALHDGFISGTSYLTTAPVPPAATPLASIAAPAAATGMEVVFRPDPHILDGRNINNGWLQELPKPLSKITWDNVAYISARTADRMNIPIARVGNEDQPVIEVKAGGRSTQIPVWVLPGTADDVVVVHFGYGRTRTGRVGTGTGHDTFGLRTSQAPWFAGSADVSRTGTSFPIYSTQNHFAMEGRNPVRVVEIEEFTKNPKAVEELGAEKPGPALSMYPAREYNGHKWGMAIDLNACTGCGVCVAACVAENNIPVVGKDQVYRSREMHWIRVDTYFEGAPDAPTGTYHQPVPCQQCEDAPCEVVCPVAATVHSDEGLNDMVYNRCVGTRYCSNNCPYKVRRFNFLLYSDFVTPELMAQRNPDVTIRSRGVMEKCTYCVQRINHARIDAKTAGREIADGDIQTACEQACPADAIVFGNLNDANSRVAKLKAEERNYGLLEDLGPGRGRAIWPGCATRTRRSRLSAGLRTGIGETFVEASQFPKGDFREPLPVIGSGYSFRSITDKLAAIVLTKNTPLVWFVFMGVGFVLLNGFFVAVTYLLFKGTGIWGNNIPVGWAFPIINFVWWIGIGHAGTLISAILLLFKQDWRTSINRFAEAMTIFAVICAAQFPLIHTGRPWLAAYWLFPYPNTMTLWPNFRSPLIWDVFAVSTYGSVSALFWIIGLIPDFATFRDKAANPVIKKLYGFAALGWRGSARHWERYEHAYLLLAGLSTPLVLSVHTVVSFDFSVGIIPGWHATIFPPYFVAGAVYAGFAMVLTLAIPLRVMFRLQDFITMRHIENMAKVMLVTGLVVVYGYACEAFFAWYSANQYERFMMFNRMWGGPYAYIYWLLLLCNFLVPQMMWSKRLRRNILAVFVAAMFVNVGMWLERFVIIVTSLHRDFMPSSWQMYHPTMWDFMTFLGTIGMFLTLMFLFVRLLPMISVFEMRTMLPEARPKADTEGGSH